MPNTVKDKVIAYEVFVDGNRKLGTASAELPKIAFKSETLKGAGIAGEIDMPTLAQAESMQLTLTWRTIDNDRTELLQQKAHNIELRAAQQHYDSGTGVFKVQAVKINVRAVPKESETGKLEGANNSDSTNVMECLYYKESIDGETRVEIDKLNYICRIHGTDFAADVRSALGI